MSANELWTSTPGGALLAAAVLLPFVGMLLGLLLGGRWLQRVAPKDAPSTPEASTTVTITKAAAS